MSLYMQFAISLVFDLGLNKPAPKDTDAMSDDRFHLSQVQLTRNMDGRRAVLSSFVASSVYVSDLCVFGSPLTETMR